jgi:uncharacterized membrane protein
LSGRQIWAVGLVLNAVLFAEMTGKVMFQKQKSTKQKLPSEVANTDFTGQGKLPKEKQKSTKQKLIKGQQDH